MTSRATFLSFLIIPLLFVGSIIMTRSATWGIGPIVYTVIQIIAGIGLYIFLGAIILGLCLIVANILHTPLPMFVSWFILTLSIVGALTGLIQSRFISVVTYEVSLPNAPSTWNGRTAVLVSDTHFGLVNYEKFSDKVVDAILELKPDLVLHAGDFYDGPGINTAPLTASWQRLTHAIPVFMAPGNHEMYGAYTEFLDSLRAAGIVVLDDKKTEFDGVQIGGITYRSGADPIEATSAIRSLDIAASQASILINHPPTSLTAAHDLGIDLQVSGHTHNGQFWPMTYLIRSIYGPQYYGHTLYKTLQTITTSGVGTFGPPFRLFNPPELVVITFRN